MDLKIEDAGVQDAGELLTVQRAAYVSEAVRYGTPLLPPLLETLDELREQLAGPTVYLKATLHDRVVGAVRGSIELPGNGPITCHVGRLVVVPDLQRRGIGRRLLVELEARALEASRFELFTGDRSVDNLALYTSLGYREFDRRPAGPDMTLVYLEKHRDAWTRRSEPGW